MSKKEDIRKMITKADTRKWKQEMEQKSTLHIYRTRKESIREDKYGNSKESDIWFRAKTNCLDLWDRKREESTGCKMCGREKEDLRHFLLNCGKLSHIRTRSIHLQRPHNDDFNRIIGDFLFSKEEMEKKKQLLYEMWITRNNIIKHLN